MDKLASVAIEIIAASEKAAEDCVEEQNMRPRLHPNPSADHAIFLAGVDWTIEYLKKEGLLK